MIRAMIVDDEQPSINKLGRLLEESGMAEVTAAFTRPKDALAFLKENKVHAVFLDIEMPEMDGIELASQMIELQKGLAVVFVTAYNEYAVEAFRLNALDYLLKPVTGEILKETLYRIIEEKNISPSTEEVQVRMFGRFSVRVGKENVRFRTEKAEELLAFLVDKKGGFISRREIIDSLWEDFDGDRALMHFNTTLHYVKKALLYYGVKMFSTPTYDRGGYNFDLEGLECDYLKFSSSIEKVNVLGQESIPALEEAASLFKCEYLSGWEYNWVERKRLMMAEQFITLLLEISEYYKKAGNYQKAFKWLELGLPREPLHRELNYRLIEVLLLANERILASKYYKLYRNGLLKNLGQEPDEALRKLML